MTTPTVTPAATREQASCGASKAKTNNDSFASSASQQLARDLEGIKGKLESIADAERSEPYKPLVKQIPIADGFLMLEVKIPPKQDVLHKAGEWLGLSRPEPISYCIKDRSGSQLLELHLDLSSHGESLVKVRKFDGYSGVRYDEAIQNFVGATNTKSCELNKSCLLAIKKSCLA
jgi:hypothetical protein